MLVTTKEMLLDAQKNNYAVGAFNAENMEMVMAIVEAADEMNSPVIIQTTPSTIKYAGLDYFFANAKVAAQRASIPVAIHLDHGNSFELCMKAQKEGYTSLMIDGSHLSIEENIHLTKKTVEVCKINNIPIEAELGKIGGKEDDLDGGESRLSTSPEQAKYFVESCGCDSLAIAIGTAHGFYKGEPKLDFETLRQIRALVDIPLVLHGTSGVPDESVKKCIALGINKVNYATDLRVMFTQGIKEVLLQDETVFDPKKYNTIGKEKVKQYVKDKIQVCGSLNKHVKAN